MVYLLVQIYFNMLIYVMEWGGIIKILFIYLQGSLLILK